MKLYSHNIESNIHRHYVNNVHTARAVYECGIGSELSISPIAERGG
jgi:hypothetical protein